MKSYDYKFLNIFCKENKITLIKDYSKDNLTSRSKILFKCTKKNCKLTTELLFQTLVKDKDNLFCKECKIRKPYTKKRVFNLDFLNKFCNENNIILLKDYSNTKINGKTLINCKCITKNCNKSFEKTVRNLDRNNCFYCKDCMITHIINNNKNKDLKYNNNIYDIKCLLTLCKDYNIILGEDYSDKNITRDSIIKGKCNKKDCNKNFEKGFRTLNDNKSFYCDECLKDVINERKIITFIKNYGVNNPFKSENIKKKIKESNIEKYGYEHQMHNSEIAEKCSKNAYLKKEYIMPSGKKITIQGYENFLLNDLLNKNIKEEDIVTSRTEVPEIWYYDKDNKEHRYYVDAYVKSLNKFYEVKSIWTYEKNKEKIELCKEVLYFLGYDYEIIIYSDKGEIINKFDNNY